MSIAADKIIALIRRTAIIVSTVFSMFFKTSLDKKNKLNGRFEKDMFF